MSAHTTTLGSLFDGAPDLLDFTPETAPATAPSNLTVMPKRTLREHLNDVDAIAETIEALDADDLDDVSRDALSEMLIKAIAGTREKIDSSTRVLAMFEHLEAAAAAEAARLAKRASGFARRRDRLETYLLAVLEASKLTKIEGNTSAITVRLNPASVVIDEGIQLAPEFLRTPPPPAAVPDKTAIKAALTRKEYVPGCRLERAKRLVRS